MGRYIDADKLIIHKFTAQEASHNDMCGAYRQGWNDAIDAVVDNEPTADVVEVVRCQNCKHWEGEYRNGFWYFEQCSLNDHVASSDDFCSYGERADT